MIPSQHHAIRLAIVYHSGYGHTARVADLIAEGARAHVATAEVRLLPVEALDLEWLEQADAIIFGAPTYMGGLSAPFKQFMDDSSKQWFQQRWKDKVAAGFTNSGALSGDKLNALLQLAVFATQHGMIWVGQAEMQEGHGPEDINRMGSNLGLMTQSDNAPPEETPPTGDLETARRFGERIATITEALVRGRAAA